MARWVQLKHFGDIDDNNDDDDDNDDDDNNDDGDDNDDDDDGDNKSAFIHMELSWWHWQRYRWTWRGGSQVVQSTLCLRNTGTGRWSGAVIA